QGAAGFRIGRNTAPSGDAGASLAPKLGCRPARDDRRNPIHTSLEEESHVSAPALIGVAAFRGTYTARPVQLGEAPEVLVPLLRRIWTDTFDRDINKMAAALLARPWLRLAVNPKARRWDRHPPVPGVGYPTATGPDTLWRGSLREGVDGPVEWLYLLHLEHQRLVAYEAISRLVCDQPLVLQVQQVQPLHRTVDALAQRAPPQGVGAGGGRVTHPGHGRVPVPPAGFRVDGEPQPGAGQQRGGHLVDVAVERVGPDPAQQRNQNLRCLAELDGSGGVGAAERGDTDQRRCAHVAFLLKGCVDGVAAVVPGGTAAELGCQGCAGIAARGCVAADAKSGRALR
ncbi:hypothetical protein, partial [Micromonospora sp. b486]|uniref:hypothetical protein n=1 Tax=Micromonospora sp. b486 TaxID=3053986 RepID=UPI00259CBAC2